MQFAILTYETPSAFTARTDDEREKYWGAWRAYSRALADAGILRGGAALDLPGTAATVFVDAGSRRVQDGPFADTKAQLGGFYLVEVESLDLALEWAARCPAAADGGVEVRPLLAM